MPGFSRFKSPHDSEPIAPIQNQTKPKKTRTIHGPKEREGERGVYIEIDRLGGRNWDRWRIEAREFTRVLSCWDSSYFWGRWIYRTDMYIYIYILIYVCVRRRMREKREEGSVPLSVPPSHLKGTPPCLSGRIKKRKAKSSSFSGPVWLLGLSVEICYIHVRPTRTGVWPSHGVYERLCFFFFLIRYERLCLILYL